MINGVAKLLTKIDEQALDNIRIYADDICDVVDKLPDRAIGKTFLLFPDPWPKARHHKRRFVSQENLKRLARVMRPGAELRIASDIPDYVYWTLCQIRQNGEFIWHAQSPADWRQRPADWPETRYEQKAKQAGRIPSYLTFTRSGSNS